MQDELALAQSKLDQSTTASVEESKQEVVSEAVVDESVVDEDVENNLRQSTGLGDTKQQTKKQNNKRNKRK